MPPPADQPSLSPSQIESMLRALPAIATPLDAAECARRAERLSKQGRLAGYAAEPGLFSCAAFGAPFDYRLLARHEAGSVHFRAQRLRKLPTIYAAVLALTVWPGVVLTHSLLNTWFSWYPQAWWATWAWYVPLTLLPIPWVWRSVVRKSRASALGHAHEQIAAIAQAIEGELVKEPGM